MADSTSSMPVGTTGAGGGNMLRITGLNTGLDIDAMVKKMLTADQTKVDNAKQQQQLIQWRQEAYQSIISDVKDLQSAYFDITNSSNYLLSSNSYNNMTATSSDAAMVSGKATTTAISGNYQILVKQLAASAEIDSSSKIQYKDKTDPSKTIDATGSTKLSDLDSSLTTSDIKLNLTYNGSVETIKLQNTNGTATIQDLADAIKSQTNGSVTARFNELTGQFSIQTANTGDEYTLEINNDGSSASLLTDLNLKTPTTIQGQNAIVGIKEPGSNDFIKTEQKSNTFNINGMTYNLYQTTPNTDIDTSNTTNIKGDDPVSISVTQDTSKVHDLISNFLDKYNKLIDEIQGKLTEKKDYDYQPLTSTQESSMSDTTITNWNNKAKQGILRSDDNLQKMLDDLTNAFVSPIKDSNGNNVSTFYFGSIGSNSIGIDTSNEIKDAGKVTITDDAKFTQALQNNADEIMKLFTTTSDSSDDSTKFSQSGIFQRINQIITNNVGSIGSTYNTAILTNYANIQDDYSISGGSGTGTLPDQIYQKQLLINQLTDKMSTNQTKYYNQFTALETAMEKLNAQQSTLSMYLS
ncbi:flagellar filament capping protein FliD [Clostridium tyrobutyricum]|uniref:flagellar filament capping protein FliD n=1 Tax=Clostridium tyrobutyricum TaxID=1519 RepID=UPI001C38333F|nr:flagellar filament capping protein FliD [Clostridium tyrobutyricum]MBV4428329.1 flagellar filament capping protein FliD [Clostridium tyrobutyricum]MBV4443319.1 flagellar filament capping protein FliD [Clostridium tyrobutyricum]